MTMVSSRTAPAQSVSQFLLCSFLIVNAHELAPRRRRRPRRACRHPRAEKTGAVECMQGGAGSPPGIWDMGRWEAGGN